MHISNSKIEKYLFCPHAYYLHYFKNIPAHDKEIFRLGKKFHESIPKGECSDEIKIDKMVKALHQNKDFKAILPKIKTYEKKIYKNIEGISYMAILDGAGDNIIVEFKSSAKPWSEEKFKEQTQPQMYMKLYNAKFYYFIVSKETIPQVQFKEIKFDPKKWELIKTTAIKIRKDFEFKPLAYKNKKCFWCEYKNYCRVYF